MCIFSFGRYYQTSPKWFTISTHSSSGLEFVFSSILSIFHLFSFYMFVFFYYYYYFYFTMLYWLCHTSTCIRTGVHMFPILNPPPTSLPILSLWVIPVHQPQASCILHRTWTGNLFLIWYYTCFNAILPNHPPLPLPQSPKGCSIYISVSFAVSYTGLVTIFLNSIYMCYYTVLVFFFLAYFTLYNRLQFHPPH